MASASDVAVVDEPVGAAGEAVGASGVTGGGTARTEDEDGRERQGEGEGEGEGEEEEDGEGEGDREGEGSGEGVALEMEAVEGEDMSKEGETVVGGRGRLSGSGAEEQESEVARNLERTLGIDKAEGAKMGQQQVGEGAAAAAVDDDNDNDAGADDPREKGKDVVEDKSGIEADSVDGCVRGKVTNAESVRQAGRGERLEHSSANHDGGGTAGAGSGGEHTAKKQRI